MSFSLTRWLSDHQQDITDLSEKKVTAILFQLTQEIDRRQLSPTDICGVADAFTLSFSELQTAFPHLLKLLSELLHWFASRKPLIRVESCWLGLQIAYLKAFRDILDQEISLQRSWLDRAIFPLGLEGDLEGDIPRLRLIANIKALRFFEMTDSKAGQALLHPKEANFFKTISQVALSWLQLQGAEEMEANLIHNRLFHSLYGYGLETVLQHPLALVQLQKFYHLGASSVMESLLDRSGETSENPFFDDPKKDYYRSQLIQSLSKPLFGDYFSLLDIYIPLKGQFTNTTEVQQWTDLMDWSNHQLNSSCSIAIIEGKSASGKTSFLQVWSALLAEKLYPQCLPIYIPLKHLKTLGNTLEETLDPLFPQGNFSQGNSWLKNIRPACILLLDGLDQLPIHYLSIFVNQLVRFFDDCQRENLLHKLFITTSIPLEKLDIYYKTHPRKRSSKLYRKHGSGRFLPIHYQLDKITILPFDQEQLRQWFIQWINLQSRTTSQSYFNFLKQEKIFTKSPDNLAFNEFILRPLSLYLLGLLHRDGLLDSSLFRLSFPEFKLALYQRLICWLLGEFLYSNYRFVERKKEGLVHANRQQADIDRLLANHTPQECFNLWKSLHLPCEKPNNFPCPLPVMLFNSIGNQLYFSHRFFEDYLWAEIIVDQLTNLCASSRNFDLISPVNSTFKTLEYILGLCLIHPHCLQLIQERLNQIHQKNIKNVSVDRLWEILTSYYYYYTQLTQLQNHIQNENNSLTTDYLARIGFNNFSLLHSISQYLKITFYPCGNPHDLTIFQADRFRFFWNRTSYLLPQLFFQQLPQGLSHLNLTGACLNQLILSSINAEETDFSLADLVEANLSFCNLKNTNFSWANLAGANLKQADFEGANLEGADLSGANLIGANFEKTNLKNACLYGALLDESAQKIAEKGGAIMSWETFETYQKSLSFEIDHDLDETEFLEVSQTWGIQSAEGELVIPDFWEIEKESASLYVSQETELDEDDLEATLMIEQPESLEN